MTTRESAVPRSIGRVLDMLEIVLGDPGCNLTTAADASGLTPTTALRHLRALEARGYVTRDGGGRFWSGPTFSRLAAAVREGGPLDRLLAVAQPHLDRLAAETGESTYLAVGDGRVATYVAAAESDRAIRHVGWIGQTVPLDDTAVGAALAAPGTTVVRTGAVEPDITAVSHALAGSSRGSASDDIDVAVSVIGPAHRLDRRASAATATALEAAIDEITDDLGAPRPSRADSEVAS
ncbi:MAG: helix-turn-helix domain-containing protein [Acidimicrobiia bacterium]|nr:helix-turn-helix domain-containing protein [Acidimicrobiia bacterium]